VTLPFHGLEQLKTNFSIKTPILTSGNHFTYPQLPNQSIKYFRRKKIAYLPLAWPCPYSVHQVW